MIKRRAPVVGQPPGGRFWLAALFVLALDLPALSASDAEEQEKLRATLGQLSCARPAVAIDSRKEVARFFGIEEAMLRDQLRAALSASMPGLQLEEPGSSRCQNLVQLRVFLLEEQFGFVAMNDLELVRAVTVEATGRSQFMPVWRQTFLLVGDREHAKSDITDALRRLTAVLAVAYYKTGQKSHRADDAR
jgi:hypothetical protein